MIRILLVDSGIGGIAERYAYDLYSTLQNHYLCQVRRINPRLLHRDVFLEFRPDVMLVIHGTFTPAAAVEHARSLGVATVLWLVEDPYEIDHHRGAQIQPYEWVFTNERLAVEEYARPNVFYLPWCCNPRVHRKIIAPLEYQSDVCFVGMGFPNRLNILNEMAQRLPHLKYRLIGEWEKWGRLHPALRDACIPTVANFWEIQRYYNGAKINLNIHRDPVDPPSGNGQGVGAVSPNDRVFALAGCGAFQLVDEGRTGLWECFIRDQEIVGFGDSDDLAQKIRCYLQSPDRQRIADAARNRAYRDHTYNRRLETVFRTIKKPLPLRSIQNDIGRSRGPQPYPVKPGLVFRKVFQNGK